jgi:hypothetical protein
MERVHHIDERRRPAENIHSAGHTAAGKNRAKTFFPEEMRSGRSGIHVPVVRLKVCLWDINTERDIFFASRAQRRLGEGPKMRRRPAGTDHHLSVLLRKEHYRNRGSTVDKDAKLMGISASKFSPRVTCPAGFQKVVVQ